MRGREKRAMARRMTNIESLFLNLLAKNGIKTEVNKQMWMNV